MAFFDWDGNGSNNDFIDNMVEYQIYKECTSENDTPRHSTNTSGRGFWTVFIIACVCASLNEGLGILVILGYIFLKMMGL